MNKSLNRDHPTTSPSAGIRDMLFGDVPLDEWGTSATGEPWSHFAEARNALGRTDNSAAIAALRRVLGLRDLESRHYLQAWDSLRRLGIQPDPADAKTVLGVIVEVPVENGLDILAAYADGGSRYFNYSGAGIVMEAPTPALRNLTENLLAAARPLVARIGPWDGERPPAPRGDGIIRVSFLTPSGIHFGQGPFGAMSQDPMARAVITAATELMQALSQLPK